MAHLLLIVPVLTWITVGVALLLPGLPLLTVLTLERWVLSNFSFSSRMMLGAFRCSYLIAVFFSVYLAYILAMTFWE